MRARNYVDTFIYYLLINTLNYNIQIKKMLDTFLHFFEFLANKSAHNIGQHKLQMNSGGAVLVISFSFWKGDGVI